MYRQGEREEIRTSKGPLHGETLLTTDAIQAACLASLERMLELTVTRFGLVRFCAAPMYADVPGRQVRENVLTPISSILTT